MKCIYPEGLPHKKTNEKTGFKRLSHRYTGYISRISLCVLFTVLFLIAGIHTKSVYAESGFKIYNYTTKKTTVYNGIVPTVTLNGKKIGDDRAKGILVDGIALLPYDTIFEKSLIAADCSYDKSRESVTVSKYGIKITMTVGSKKASVNGKSVTMPLAPMKVKYVQSDLTKILVPSRFVAETLGLGYSWDSSKKKIAIEKKTLTLSYNNGAKFEYSGVQAKVTIDGSNVDLGNMPGIIVNNIAMLRAKRVFADSSIGAKYSYDKSNKKITLKKDDKTLVMTIGSKTAYLNDKKVELENAPMLVTNHEAGTSYVMVPGRSTATHLGYDYVWDKAASTSRISSKKGSSSAGSGSGNNNKDGNTAPESGNDSAHAKPGTVLNEWKANNLVYGISSGVHELTGNMSYTGTVGQLYYASNSYITRKNNSDTFMFISSAPLGDITSNKSEGLIRIAVKNFSCTDQINQISSSESDLVNYITMYSKSDSNEAVIEMNVTNRDFQYDLSLSDNKQILYITVYKNTISKASIGVDEAGDYIKINALMPIQAEITDYTGQINIMLSDTVNGLGDLNSDIAGAKYIKHIVVTAIDNATHIILTAEPGYEYYVNKSDNEYTLSLRPKGNNGSQPDTGDDKNSAGQNEADKNKNGYEIVIPKPQNVQSSMITDEDFYHEGYFVIKIKGDYTDFYKNNSIQNSSKTVKSIKVSHSNGETDIKIYTTKIQGYKIATDNEAIYVHVADPRDIYKNIAVLDPGHGGGAAGAQYFGSNEKDINLKILYTVGRKYFNSDSSKLKVYYTRYTDVDMALSDRAAFAKEVGADLFVSLHMNAAGTAPSARGSEVFYSVKNNSPNSAGLTSQKLAEMLNSNIHTKLATKDRGVKTENHTVTYKNTVPAVLIELGFISNKEDYALLTDEAFQDKAAKTIYETLLEIFKKYPTGR